MAVLKKKKTNPKNDNAKKATLRSATKSTQLVDSKQPKTPSKYVTMAAFITPEKLQLNETHEDNVTSPMIVDTS